MSIYRCSKCDYVGFTQRVSGHCDMCGGKLITKSLSRYNGELKMKLILKNEGRVFEAECEDLDDYYQAVRDGLVAMGYHPNTAKEWFPVER